MSNDGIFQVGLDTTPIQQGSGTNKSLWLTIQPDETVRVVFLLPPSEIVAYNEHNIWRGRGKTSPRFPCIGEDCPGCAPPIEHKPRYRAVAPVLLMGKGGSVESKLFGFGRMIKNDLVSISALIGEDDFVGAEVAITRTGRKLQTRYSCTLTNKVHDTSGYEVMDAREYIRPQDLKSIQRMVDDMRVEDGEVATSDSDALSDLRKLVE